MLEPKAVWDVCQASLIAIHHQKNLCGWQLEREVENPLTGTENATF